MPDGPPPETTEFWYQTGPTAEVDEATLKRHPDTFRLSRPALLRACVTEILDNALGFAASARSRASFLGDGQPIPLMSYSLIEYLMGIDFSAFDILEIGGGNSTLFWASRGKRLLTLEHDPAWLQRMASEPRDNVEVLAIKQSEYSSRLAALSRTFDMIIIDCAANRYACAVASRGKLNAGGMVILDNSDWYPNAAEELRDQGLIQIDFPDFRPDHWYRCNTSIFLHAEFRPIPLGDRLPAKVLGGKDLGFNNGWDQKT